MNTDVKTFSVGIACYESDPDFKIAPFEEQVLLLCRAHGIDACVFSPLSIDCSLDSPLIPVQYWDGEAFRKAIAPVPKILECRFNLKRKNIAAWLQPELQRWLLARCHFGDYDGIPKEQLSQLLLRSPLYAYAIPTYRITEYEELLRFTKMLRHCIVKPNSGRQGRHVAGIDHDGTALYMETEEGMVELTPEQWKSYRNALREDEMGLPLLQPRLDFSLDATHAIDFRLVTAQGGSGSWEEVDIGARIGPNSLVSNVAQGGYAGEPRHMLEQIAGARADELLATMHRIAIEVPTLIQQQVARPISSLGLDVGIDRNTLTPYVMEANTFPGGEKYHSWQMALKRAQYFQYLLKTMG